MVVDVRDADDVEVDEESEVVVNSGEVDVVETVVVACVGMVEQLIQ